MNKKILGSAAIILTALTINFAFPLHNNADDTEMITVNQPICLNYKSKQEIYDIRKSYVAKSIFANPNYEPSEEVFGGIEDNKPWISMDWCHTVNPQNKDNYVVKINGPSSHSRSLINPSLPLMIEYPYTMPEIETYYNLCTKIPQVMVPLKAAYSRSKKEVEITYKKLPYLKNDDTGYQIIGLNALDFGYNYIYLDKSKSTLKIRFLQENNLGTEVKELSDFIHLGSSCRVAGGCNNWSVARDDFQFYPLSSSASDTNQTNQNKPASTKVIRSINLGNNASTSSSQNSANNAVSDLPQLYIKLWKNKPSSPNAPADLNVKFNFQK